MNPDPIAPNVKPSALPPRGPLGACTAYAKYKAVNTAKITSDAMAHPRCVLSIRTVHAPCTAETSVGALDIGVLRMALADTCSESLRRSAAQHFRKERPGVHAVRRIVRARVNAA